MGTQRIEPGTMRELGKGIRGAEPMTCRPYMAQDAYECSPTQKSYIYLKPFFFHSSVFISVCVFNGWPKATLLPVWPRCVLITFLR